MERIALAREYRVEEWLKDAYLELTQSPPLNFEKIRPAEPEPYSESNKPDRDWEADVEKWKAVSKDWETLARISQLQMKVVASIASLTRSQKYCGVCRISFGTPYKPLCKCVLSPLVNEEFREELESLKKNPEQVKYPQALPSRRKLSIFIFICVR